MMRGKTPEHWARFECLDTLQICNNEEVLCKVCMMMTHSSQSRICSSSVVVFRLLCNSVKTENWFHFDSLC
jgi:hypothetical protein